MKKFYASALALSVAATGAFAQTATEAEDGMNTDGTVMEAPAEGMDTTTEMDTETPTDGEVTMNGDASADPMPEDNMNGDAMASGDMQGKLIRTRDITGGDIYTMNEADDEGWEMGQAYDSVGENWNDIGEIEDIVLSEDGKMIGIVAEVGGFLDIGDKHVMIEMQDVNLVAVDDKSYAFVTRLSEEELEAKESVDEGFWD
ncbi:PRC-barrel domain-containing protein [Sagittula sp. SSi028]|uniref:PRC-barrel domain-containing protein n=1 Tax=Sagittula sp. SSi028 TaxID=3400636 RepID=UPI003AF81D0A